MKELTVSVSNSFILCCVRWPDMVVIMKKLTVSGSSFFMHETYFHATEKINLMIISENHLT